MSFLVLALLLIVGSSPSLGLDMSGCKEEGDCPSTNSRFLDWNWAVKPKFYYPMMSRYYLYHVIAQMSPGIDPTKIIEGSVYYDGCLRLQAHEGGSVISGFLGERGTSYVYTPLSDPNGGIRFQSQKGPGWNGTFWISLTDNETYLLCTLCDADNQKMWMLLATTPTVCDNVKQNVLEKLYELGFKEEYFTEMRYDTCKCQKTEYSPPSSSSSLPSK